MDSPLQDLHRQSEAEFLSYGPVEIVNTFGEVPAEYAAIRKSSGLMDLPFRAVLEMTGKDRLPFLNNLLTNQTYEKQTKTPLASGKSVYAFLLNAKTGRIVTDVNVIEKGDRTWLELDRRLVPTLAQALEKYVFSEQVQLTDRSNDLHEIALHGPGSGELLGMSLGVDESSSLNLFGHDVTVWRDDPTGSPGFNLIGGIQSVRAVWEQLLNRYGTSEQLGKRRLRPIGWAAFNTARIEAGRALFGIDFDDSVLPHETGEVLNRAVSFTKGCYPGQEIVARMHARQQVARKIVGLKLDTDALPVAGAKVFDEQSNEIGGITSSTIAPMLSSNAIALAIVKKPHFNIGSTVIVPAEGEMRKASVVELPFVKLPA